jgi:hypothetical protein
LITFLYPKLFPVVAFYIADVFLSFLEVKEVFALFDKDSDGFINSQELGNVMRALGQNPTGAEVEMLTNDFSEDGK